MKDNQTALEEAARKHFRPMAPIPTGLVLRGALTPPIECLMCDVYGTLFISGSGDLVIARQQTAPMAAIQELLDRYGVRLSPDQLRDRLFETIEQHHQAAKTRGIRHPEVRIDRIWSQLLPRLDPLHSACFAVEYEMAVNPAWPMPNAADLFAACRRHGIKLGIISNAQFFTPFLFKWLLDRSMTDLGFDKALTFFSYEWGEAKPSRRLFQAAAQQLKRMGIAPHKTAYVGNDIGKDVIPAGGAGFQTVLFAGDARSLRLGNAPPDPEAVLPDLVVTDLQQLIEYL